MTYFLTWDGSDISDAFEKEKTEYQLDIINDIRYISIFKNQDEKIGIFLFEDYKNPYPLIIDEIKKLFHLPFIGRHKLRLGRKYYIISRVQIDENGDIIPMVTLKDYCEDNEVDVLFMKQVSEIFTFRELLGIKKTYETNIMIRKGEHRCYPVSYVEKNVIDCTGKNVLSEDILNKWFNHNEFNECIRTITNIDKNNIDDNMTVKTCIMRYKIQNIINRIDSGYIEYADFIHTRILNQIQI